MIRTWNLFKETHKHTHPFIHTESGIGNEVPTRPHAHKINVRTSSMPFSFYWNVCIFLLRLVFRFIFPLFFQWVCLLMHTVFGFAFFCRRRRHRLWAPQFCFCLLVFALMLLVNFVSDQIYSLFSLPYTIFPTPEIITSTSHPIRPIQFQWLSKHRLNLRERFISSTEISI